MANNSKVLQLPADQDLTGMEGRAVELSPGNTGVVLYQGGVFAGVLAAGGDLGEQVVVDRPGHASYALIAASAADIGPDRNLTADPSIGINQGKFIEAIGAPAHIRTNIEKTTSGIKTVAAASEGYLPCMVTNFGGTTV